MTGARVYLRVSSERQSLGASLETQRAAIARYCREHGIPILHEYCDVLSGTRDERPRYQAMLAEVQSGETIVVWRMDRIGRRKSELFRLFEWCKQRHIGVVSVTQPEMSNELARDIMSVLAAYESQQIAERVLPSMATRAAEGRWVSRVPRFYVIGPNGHLAPGPDAADAPRLWATMLATGSVVATAATFDLPIETIKWMLRNRVYLGEAIWRGIAVPDAHPALVPRATWEAANALLDARRTEKRREWRGTALLTGFLYVRDTARRLYHVTYADDRGAERRVRRYYLTRTGDGPRQSVRAEDAERAVVDWLAGLEVTRGERAAVARQMRDRARDDPHKRERAALHRRIAALEAEVIETARMEAQRRVDAATAERMRQAQARDLAAVRAARDALPPAPNPARDRARLDLRLRLAERVRHAYAEGNTVALRALVAAFVARVEIWDGDCDRSYLRQPPREIRVVRRD